MNVEQGIIVAQSFAAFGTLVLAGAAYKNIKQTKQLQFRQRRENQLREVAGWAVDVINARLLVGVPSIPYEYWDSKEPEHMKLTSTVISFMLSNTVREINAMINRGENIRYISMNIKDKDEILHASVEDTIRTLTAERDSIIEDKFLDHKTEFILQTREAVREVLKRVSELMVDDYEKK